MIIKLWKLNVMNRIVFVLRFNHIVINLFLKHIQRLRLMVLALFMMKVTKNIAIEVKNNSDKTYGGQVWIDNLNGNEIVLLFLHLIYSKITGGEKTINPLCYM